MNRGACILDAFGQLWEIPCFKGLRGGGFPRKRDKDFILKLLVRWETRSNSAQKLNRRKSTNHHNRYAPRNFYRSTSGLITAGRSHFLHCTILVKSRVNPTTQSRKARHCNCYPKNYLVWYRICIAIRGEFLASRVAKFDVPISEGISQADLGVADSRYESPFLGSYKTHYTSFIALPESWIHTCIQQRPDLNPLSQWLLTQPWIAYSEELPIAPALGPRCLAE